MEEIWITAVADEAGAKDALNLAKSLRKTFTRRKIYVISSLKISAEIQESLMKTFDKVLPLMESLESTLSFEKAVKVFLHMFPICERGIFLSSSVLIVGNSDFLFEKLFDSSSSLETTFGAGRESESEIAMFCASPSKKLSRTLLEDFKAIKENRKTLYEESLDKFPAINNLDNEVRALFDEFGIDLSSPMQMDSFCSNPKNGVKILKLPYGYSTKIRSEPFAQFFETELGFVVKDVLELSNMTGVSADEHITLERMKEEPIAIIGMACRLPGSNNLEEFWNLMVNKEDAIRKVPEWRWKEEQVPKFVSDTERECVAGFLKCPVDETDAQFFGMSPKEMEFMDPQQRLLLEVSWEALEDAAVDPKSIYGTRTGIFTGMWRTDYFDMMKKLEMQNKEFFRSFMGNSFGATSGRLAHFYGTTGTNIATESGCSSSTVAVGLACSHLRSHKISMAMACGVNLITLPCDNKLMAPLCSEDGRCKAFDAAADGFGVAEGCVVIVLKRLSDAVRDGDVVRAVIRGYGEAQEGTSSSLGTPTVDVQKLAMKAALREAEIQPWEVSFVEAHGTGTAVGDPLEMDAIAQIYSNGSNGNKIREEPLVVTSVKTNVGHTESVSGITGIIKAVLALEHQALPPHRSLNKINPKIELSKIPAVIPLEVTPWPKQKGKKRIAAVSSFGITGTDTHVILEEAPSYINQCEFKNSLDISKKKCNFLHGHILTLSAKSKKSLKELLSKYSDKLKTGNLEWKDVAVTSNIGRTHFKEYRSAVNAKDTKDFLHQFEHNKVKVFKCQPGTTKKIVFLFTGQGSQYKGMAKGLYEFSTEFRKHFDKCDNILRTIFDIDIKRAIWDDESSDELLNQTLYSQTAIFVVDYCLAKLWISWGIVPDFVVGHSLGEYAAACVAGIMNLNDAIHMVAERSRIINNLSSGKMIVVNTDYESVIGLLEKMGDKAGLDIAALNSKEQTAVAGIEDSVLALKQLCDKRGLRAHVLGATHAFHSQMMNDALPQLRNLASQFSYGQPKLCKFISGMTGVEMTDIDAEYWVRHTRESVNFVKACESLKKEADKQNCLLVGVEVGPQPILSSFISENIKGISMLLLPSLRRSNRDTETISDSLCQIYLSGMDINWRNFHSGQSCGGLRISGLPTYQFQRKRYWFEKPKSEELLHVGKPLHPLLHHRLPLATTTCIFHSYLSCSKPTYINGHVVGTEVIFPAAAYLEMYLAAGHSSTLAEYEDFRFASQQLHLCDFVIETPTRVTAINDIQLQTIVHPPDNENWCPMSIHRRAVDAAGTSSWIRNSSAKYSSFSTDSNYSEFPETINLQLIKESWPTTDADEFYQGFRSMGLNYANSFLTVQQIWETDDEILTELLCPVGDDYFVHPVAIDGMIHTLLGLRGFETLRIPVKIERFSWNGKNLSGCPNTTFYVYANKNSTSASAVLLNTHGEKVAAFSGVTFVSTSTKAIDAALESQNIVLPEMYTEEWVPMKLCYPTEPLDLTLPTNFLDTPTELQESLMSEEGLQYDLINELAVLQYLKVFLEMNWIPKVFNCLIDVRQLVSKFQIPKKLPVIKGFLEIICTNSAFLTKVHENGFIFRVSSPVPPIAKVENIIKEIKTLNSQTYQAEIECLDAIVPIISEVLSNTDSIDSQEILLGNANIGDKCRTEFKVFDEANNVLVNAVRELCQHWSQIRNNEGYNLRILEVADGTIAWKLRSKVISVLEESGAKFLYTFTDTSVQSDTENLEKKDYLNFKKLDVERDPKIQGFIPEEYDVVISWSNIINTSGNLAEAIRNLRHLLKPNGLLLSAQLFKPQPIVDAVLGLFDSYWNCKEIDEEQLVHPVLSEQNWRKLLSSEGFTSSTRFMKNASADAGVLVAQATSHSFKYTPPKLQTCDIWIIVPDFFEDMEILKQVTSDLRKYGRRTLIVTDDLMNFRDKVENSLVEGILFLSTANESDVDKTTNHFLKMIQTLISCKSTTATLKLVVATTGAVKIGDQLEVHPGRGTLLGMSRTFRSEISSCEVLNIDLDPAHSNCEAVQSLIPLLWANLDADFIAVRDKKTFYAKLKLWNINKMSSLDLPSNNDRFCLTLPNSKRIEDLKFGTASHCSLEKNQVEIQLRAAALNFKDVFSVLKPTEDFEKSAAVGADMAGVVTAIGEQTNNLKVGDRVFGAFFYFGGLPSHVVVAEDDLIKIPEKMTFADASTLPVVFTTAYYSLIEMAKLVKGETVLIHTGSGGVGLAAIQIARAFGANIITTAGSARKRKYLKDILGLQSVFNSRDLSYADEIRQVTNGNGVDVVLNSLTSPGFKEASLDICAKNARFIEMSKLNIYTECEVKEIRPDVSYHVVDLTTVSQKTWRYLLKRLKEFIEEGNLYPLPYELFESVDIREALTHLQNANHIGKIVIKMPETSEDINNQRRHCLFNDRSSYLITGGFGGIGIEAAKWVVSEGAKFIILCGRNTPNEKALRVISELNAMGKVIVSVKLDVGKYEDCRLLIDKINSGNFIANGDLFPPLRGIQHAAGCLSDATFPNQTWEKYEETFNGKVKGAWNLHQLTSSLKYPLEHFVMYSSIASTFGSIGQSNHAAGNAFLDAMAHFRHSQGLPATSVNWGQWGQVGIAADLELDCFTPFTPLQAFASLKQILRHHKIQVGVVRAVVTKLGVIYPWISRNGYAGAILGNMGSSSSTSLSSIEKSKSVSTEKFWENIEEAKRIGMEKVVSVIQRWIIEVIRRILKLEEEESIDLDGSLRSLGFDSLMIIELKNLLQVQLGSKLIISSNDLHDSSSISKLVADICKKLTKSGESSVEKHFM